MSIKQSVCAAFAAGVLAGTLTGQTMRSGVPDRPDPHEIPLPPIKTAMPAMPGVNQLPNRPKMPDVMTLNNGQKVKTLKDWQERREQMKRVLEYYAVGQAPPPPGNVQGMEVSSQLLAGGKVKYRLVHLSFGPNQSLGFDIGIFLPAQGGPFPAVISPAGTPPGATPLPRLPQGANQGSGQDVLLVVGPASRAAETAMAARMRALKPRTAEEIAESNPALLHGFAFVTFNYNDCGEDTTLRLPDGSWAYRTTRFFPAYPDYDWGLLRAWAWGESRIAEYLVTDPEIDGNKLILTGVSRTGKAALVAGAFDERFAMVAPVASSGGGTPAYRFSGSMPDRGGREGLTEMVRKYPNWFSPHLHQFWGQPDKLPFDEHWFIALVAPRPLIALEGDHDQNVNQNGVYQSWLAAQPAYAFFHATDRLGVSWADRPHGMVQGDWDALLAFADEFLLGKPVARSFDRFPPGVGQPTSQASTPPARPGASRVH